ncbi:uridine kinase [Fodinicola feengrottensis]|uniref:uridine kinase n=1 Tax=Fodinicola feengrottensis TaxID=435914 RepID=UPI0031D0BA5C
MNVIRSVAEQVAALPHEGVVKVGVDGVDGAGKTVFAGELADAISGRPVIRAGVDGFHQPRSVRYRRGRTSPEGYFRDSYDYPALHAALLDPLSTGGDRKYRRAMFDHVADRPVEVPVEQAAPDAVLVFDGIFLHRPELAGYWDYSIFLDVQFAASFARMAGRDGSNPHPDAPANQRYVRGQMLYLATCRPATLASIVIDNSDLDCPRVVRCQT